MVVQPRAGATPQTRTQASVRLSRRRSAPSCPRSARWGKQGAQACPGVPLTNGNRDSGTAGSSSAANESPCATRPACGLWSPSPSGLTPKITYWHRRMPGRPATVALDALRGQSHGTANTLVRADFRGTGRPLIPERQPRPRPDRRSLVFFRRRANIMVGRGRDVPSEPAQPRCARLGKPVSRSGLAPPIHPVRAALADMQYGEGSDGGESEVYDLMSWSFKSPHSYLTTH